MWPGNQFWKIISPKQMIHGACDIPYILSQRDIAMFVAREYTNKERERWWGVALLARQRCIAMIVCWWQTCLLQQVCHCWVATKCIFVFVITSADHDKHTAEKKCTGNSEFNRDIEGITLVSEMSIQSVLFGEFILLFWRDFQCSGVLDHLRPLVAHDARLYSIVVWNKMSDIKFRSISRRTNKSLFGGKIWKLEGYILI